MANIDISINQVIVYNINGITIFSKYFQESEIDHSLLSAFFSAIRQFAATMVSGEIEGIKIGKYNLNFKILPMEPENFILVMISHGYSNNDADQIAEKIAEDFSINFENFLQDKNMTLLDFEKNPNLYIESLERYYSPLCEEIVKNVTSIESLSLEISVKVPHDILLLLYDVLALKPALSKIYQGTRDLLVEIIQTYLRSDEIKEDIEKRYVRHVFE
ncbi:MAG: hypothetical protein ACTSVI_14385 [Promethearchaeota archaeon]